MRFVALALLAPLFGVPAATLATAAPASAAVHRVVATQAGADRLAPTRAGATSRYTRKLSAPAKVHLLAARLYWGRHHLSYPSVHKVRRDLTRTARWYADVSRGREHVRFTVTRWVHVRTSADIMCNTEGGSIRAARAALRRAGYHPDRFNRLMIFTEQCNGAASAAQLPGHVTWVRFRNPGMPTLVHELGHNLGLEHAFGVKCVSGQMRVALGGTCTRVEYGDSWDAMGHSKGWFSAPALVRLGWAGHVQDVTASGTFAVADVEHSGSATQALRIRDGRTTYWVEYQPEHSPQIGRTIPGVMIRREVGSGPVEIVDASPGNPAGIAYPDRDLTNAALPVGSSLTTPGSHIRITTVSTGSSATVQVTFGEAAQAPEAPEVKTVTAESSSYRVSWTAPADNGQIVLGYQVTASPSGVTRFVQSPGAFRTSVTVPVNPSDPQTFTVRALNQVGWSADSVPLGSGTGGPQVTVNSPEQNSPVASEFTVSLNATPDPQTQAALTGAWADVSSGSCTSQDGAGPSYMLQCTGVATGQQQLVVHVQDAQGAITDVPITVNVQ